MTGRTVEQSRAMATSGKWSQFSERRRRLPTRLSNPLAWTVAAKTIARVELAEGAEDIATRGRGKLRWFTIGRHGRITAEEARAAALKILTLTKKGIEPREADAKRKAEPVMAELGRRFLEEYVPVHCKPSTQAEYRRSVTLFIDPALGEMRITGSIGEGLAPDDARG